MAALLSRTSSPHLAISFALRVNIHSCEIIGAILASNNSRDVEKLLPGAVLVCILHDTRVASETQRVTIDIDWQPNISEVRYC